MANSNHGNWMFHDWFFVYKFKHLGVGFLKKDLRDNFLVILSLKRIRNSCVCLQPMKISVFHAQNIQA